MENILGRTRDAVVNRAAWLSLILAIIWLMGIAARPAEARLVVNVEMSAGGASDLMLAPGTSSYFYSSGDCPVYRLAECDENSGGVWSRTIRVPVRF